MPLVPRNPDSASWRSESHLMVRSPFKFVSLRVPLLAFQGKRQGPPPSCLFGFWGGGVPHKRRAESDPPPSAESAASPTRRLQGLREELGIRDLKVRRGWEPFRQLPVRLRRRKSKPPALRAGERMNWSAGPWGSSAFCHLL